MVDGLHPPVEPDDVEEEIRAYRWFHTTNVDDPHTKAWCMQRLLVEMGGETAVWRNVPGDD
jgi:hypothetical protein